MTLLPYFDGERTPNRPDARATLTGISTATTREDVARAYVEGLLCSLADGITALEDRTGTVPARITLIGGAARSQAVQQLAPAIFGREVTIAPERGVRGARRRPPGRLGALRLRAAAGLDDQRFPHRRCRATPEVLGAYRALKEREKSGAERRLSRSRSVAAGRWPRGRRGLHGLSQRRQDPLLVPTDVEACERIAGGPGSSSTVQCPEPSVFRGASAAVEAPATSTAALWGRTVDP